MPGEARPVGIREANGFGNEWKPGGLPEPNPTEPAGETGSAAHPNCCAAKVTTKRSGRGAAALFCCPVSSAGDVFVVDRWGMRWENGGGEVLLSQ